MITLTTGYHNDQEIHFVETSTPRIYKRTKDNVQSSYRGSILTAHKWLVTYDNRSKVFKTRKAAIAFLTRAI